MREGERCRRGWSAELSLWVSACLVSILSLGGVAQARDVCVVDQNAVKYVFSKVAPRRPGRSVALNGVMYGGGMPVSAVNGTAYMTSTRTVNIGVYVHSMQSSNGLVNYTVAIRGADANFGGVGEYADGGDDAPDGPVTWTSVDCATLTRP